MNKLKRLLSILLVLTCLFGLLGISASAVEDGGSTVGIVTASALRLRKSASTGSAILAIVSKGESVTVLSQEGDWCKVQYGKTVGYMSKEYLSLTGQTGTSSGSSSSDNLGTAKIAYTVVNLRSNPSTSASLVCQAKEGDSVTLLELDNGWYKVSYKSKTAYVRSDLVNLDNASSGSGSSSEGSSSGSSSSSLGTGKISSSLVNLRSGPATSYSIVYQVPFGTSVTLLELNNDWYKVSYKNQTAYVRSDLVSTGSSSGSTSSGSSSEGSSGNLGTAKIAYTLVNLRSGPSTGSSLVCQAKEGDSVTLLALDNGWYKVSYKSKTAYVRSDLVKEDSATSGSGSSSEGSSSGSSSSGESSSNLGTGKISGSLVNLRSGPATSYSIVYQVPYGTSVTLLELNNDWYKVSYKDKTAYVRSDLISTGSSSGSGSSSEGGSSSSSGSAGEAIVAKAKEYLGCPYVWGGISPNGFDCSGFTYYVLRACDYKIGRLASSQMSAGKSVSRSELQPGDLVFFTNTYNTTGISHVGIYIGNGQFIHAQNSKTGVVISDMAGYYDNHYYGACRVW